MSKHFRDGFKKAACQCVRNGKIPTLPSMVVEESIAGHIAARQTNTAGASPSKYCCKHQERAVVTNNHGLRINKSRNTAIHSSSCSHPRYCVTLSRVGPIL